MRGISTVLDVAVFLLLVSAAVATLTLAPDVDGDVVAVDDRANVLASATADVEYTVRGADRRAHGTVATLLARAAVENATIDGRRLSDGSGFGRRVRSEALSTLGPTNRTQVVVRWEPYRGAPLRGTLHVGPSPPRRADVTVATVTVPAPTRAARGSAVSRAGRDGFRGVAAPTARAAVEALLPETSAVLPARAESPARAVASARTRTLAAATGASVADPLSEGNVSAARGRVVSGLTDLFAADMRDRFSAPTDAAAAVRTGTVRLTLRRWAS